MITGILLAAGQGRRFQQVQAQASGALAQSKCLTPLADGTPLVIRAAENLLSAVDRLVCVIRADDPAMAALLAEQTGELARKLIVVHCAQAQLGMAESIKAGINATADSNGWLLAFADMPFIKPATCRQIAAQLQHADTICVPVYRSEQENEQRDEQKNEQKGGQKDEQGTVTQGHPVAFGAHWRAALLALQGDRGAKVILQQYSHQVTWLAVTDPAVSWDVDEPADLLRYQKALGLYS